MLNGNTTLLVCHVLPGLAPCLLAGSSGVDEVILLPAPNKDDVGLDDDTPTVLGMADDGV